MWFGSGAATVPQPAAGQQQHQQHQQHQQQQQQQQANSTDQHQHHTSGQRADASDQVARKRPAGNNMQQPLPPGHASGQLGQLQPIEGPEKISFHLKTSIFTHRITIDSDKMALGLIKQLAISFLNEIYFRQAYPSNTYVGDYIQKHFANPENLAHLYDRILLRKYNPIDGSFSPFNSVGDIDQDSYISIELSERNQAQLHLLSGAGCATNLSGSSANSMAHLAGHSYIMGQGCGPVAAPISSALSPTSASAASAPSAAASLASSPSGQTSAPTSMLKIAHDFHQETFLLPTHCASCSALIKGIYKQGFQCYHCRKNYCPKCRVKAESLGEGCLAQVAMSAPIMSASTCGAHQPTGSPQATDLTNSSNNNGGTLIPATATSQPPSSSATNQHLLAPNQAQQPSSSSSSSSNNLNYLGAGVGQPEGASMSSGANVIGCSDTSNKLEANHSNMSKRKSASNLLHFNIANPFKSHHNQQQQQQSATSQQNQATSQQQHQIAHHHRPDEQPPKSSVSTLKSLRGSTGALDPFLQQLRRDQQQQQQLQQQQQQQLFLQKQQQQTNPAHELQASEQSRPAAGEQSQQSSSSSSGDGPTINGPYQNMLGVHVAQMLSSSHQNLYTIGDNEAGGHLGDSSPRDLSSAAPLDISGSSSVQQSPSKQSGTISGQLSNSARTSARDLVHSNSPTRRDQSANNHALISLDWMQLSESQCCGVCNKTIGQSRHLSQEQQQQQQQLQQSPSMCKICKIYVHHQCKDLVLADCLSRLTESSRAAASHSMKDNKNKANQEADKSNSNTNELRGTSSNMSRDNIRLHRLAPSVKHVKRPDPTKSIIEGWLRHKTLSDEQLRKHYWRLDDNDITLYDDATSTRYFKAIALSKITRVLSASSLPKQIKEDVLLSDQQLQTTTTTTTKSATSSPTKTPEFRCQMEVMFGFEVATGSVYLVRANDPAEAKCWKSSLDRITAKQKLVEAKQRLAEAAANEQAATSQLAGSGLAAPSDQSSASSGQPVKQNTDEQVLLLSSLGATSSETSARLSPATQNNQQEQPKRINKFEQSKQQQQFEAKAAAANQADQMAKTTGGGGGDQVGEQQKTAKQTRQHHHHHHHHHHQQQQQQPNTSSINSGYRSQQKTYTDPNRSRLYNRPRIKITLDPMSIPDHLIEGKYLIERDRVKGKGFEELGSGQFGKVYAAISEIKNEDKGCWSGVPVAIKEISKSRFDLLQQAKLKNEANILSRLDHPGVIILERVHDLANKIYIVMEQLEDDMLEMIVSTPEKRLTERVTKFLTYQILEALKYLHKQNIAHCDLKPENVLLVERRAQYPQIKLCDFGFAKIIEENSFRRSLVGTPAYLAPEVVRGERYNRSVDVWSVGVIVYVSLSGEFPFNDGENIHDQISRANFMYPDQPWAKISSQAKSFINSLLRVNSDIRLSANRAQLDLWLQDFNLWCDLCELELKVGKRWLTAKSDFDHWSDYAKKKNIPVPRSAVLLHEQSRDD